MLRQALARRSVTSSCMPNNVVSVTTPFAGPAAAVGVFSDLGSRSEDPSTSGTCAVVARAKALEAAPKIAALGGVVAGDSSRDHSSLVATVPAAQAAEAAKVLAGVTGKAAFAEAQAAALADLESAAPNMVEAVHACAYLDAPYGLPAAGTAASVAALTESGAEAFVASQPSTLVVAGAGCEDLSAFGGGAKGPTDALAAPAGAAIFTGSDARVSYDDMPLASVCLAYEFPTADSALAPAARLLPYILGSSGPSTTSLAEAYNSHGKMARDMAEQGAAASLAPFYLPYADTALFGVAWLAPDVRLEDGCYYVTNNLVRLCYDVTEAELARAKLQFRNALAAELSAPAATATFLARSVQLLGAAQSPAELLADVEAVPLEDVKKVAYAHIHDTDHALAAVGPVHELPDYMGIRTMSYDNIL